MKWDMAGAGTVVGLMAALAGRKAKVDAVGLVGLVENMPSGSAQRPGDVVKSYSGQTIEVINTDAEGRLVLADVHLVLPAEVRSAVHGRSGDADRRDHHLARPRTCGVVQQRRRAGGEAARRPGKETGEKLWRMPLDEAYDKQIKSDIADMKNIGGRPAGSITAAQFIKRFVNDKPWAHLDIAGMAWSSKDAPTVPKGATAFGVRLLDRLVAAHYEG